MSNIFIRYILSIVVVVVETARVALRADKIARQSVGGVGREYQNSASGIFEGRAIGERRASPWGTQFAIFGRADRAVEKRERNSAFRTCGGRRPSSRLHAGVRTSRFEPAPVFALAGVAKRMEVSLSSFRPRALEVPWH
jgi:hypothetical protein